MIKSRAYDVAKSKKKVAEGKKKSGFCPIHIGIILTFVVSRIHRKLLAKILLVFVAVFLSITFFEIGIRLFEEKHFDLSSCQSLDRNFHHVMIPNSSCRFKTDEWDVTYKINGYGLRDERIPNKQSFSTNKSEKFRILLLGDSFAQGHGVEAEDSFGEILEEMLKEEVSGKFEVINAGVFGYSPLVEYLYLKKAGLEFNPDLVIFSFSLTDFWEDRQRFFELRQSYPLENDSEIKGRIASADVEFNWEKINSGDKSTVLEKSKLKEEIFKLKQWLKKNFRIYQKLADYRDSRNTVVQQDIIYQGDIDKDIVALVRGDKISESDWQKLWELPLFHIAISKRLLDENGIPLVVVGIPDAFAVSEKEWPGREALGIPINFSDSRGPYQLELSNRLATLDIPFIDMLEEFKKSGIFPLYFSRDGHFRQSGHALTASVIFRQLENYLPNLH